MSGVVAAIVFPLMRKLEPTLASYPDYEGDHAMLAGGRLASSVFLAVDMIQFVCASLALATLATMIVTGYTINTIPRLLRIMVLCATLALLSYHLFIFHASTDALVAWVLGLCGCGRYESSGYFQESVPRFALGCISNLGHADHRGTHQYHHCWVDTHRCSKGNANQ